MTKNKRNILKVAISILLILMISVGAMADKVRDKKDENIDEDWKEPENVKIGDEKPIITIDPITKEGRAIFIHWDKKIKKDDTKRNAKDTKKGVTIKPVSGPCYSTFGIRGTPIKYVINPKNPQGLSQEFVTFAISTSAETWDAATPRELFDNSYTIDTRAKFGRRDNKNAIVFGRYYYPWAIAVTGYWFNSATGQIYESDMLFNTNYMWGDATIDPSKMDLQNIATHEFGHVVGMDDIYDSACSEVTMYGYSGYGETKERTLELPDITGLLALYPS